MLLLDIIDTACSRALHAIVNVSSRCKTLVVAHSLEEERKFVLDCCIIRLVAPIVENNSFIALAKSPTAPARLLAVKNNALIREVSSAARLERLVFMNETARESDVATVFSMLSAAGSSFCIFCSSSLSVWTVTGAACLDAAPAFWIFDHSFSLAAKARSMSYAMGGWCAKEEDGMADKISESVSQGLRCKETRIESRGG